MITQISPNVIMDNIKDKEEQEGNLVIKLPKYAVKKLSAFCDEPEDKESMEWDLTEMLLRIIDKMYEEEEQ
jgi:hypothetical protein